MVPSFAPKYLGSGSPLDFAYVEGLEAIGIRASVEESPTFSTEDERTRRAIYLVTLFTNSYVMLMRYLWNHAEGHANS